MIQGHTIDALVAPTSIALEQLPWSIWHFVRGLTAPVFLMLSGALQVLANKRDANGFIGRQRYLKQIRWALTLIGIGYLLVFPANRLRDLPFVTQEGWHFFFQVNILQLSGLTLLGVMTIMYFTRSTRRFASISLVVGITIALLSPLVQRVDWWTWLPSIVANYLSFAKGSLFCIFPFSAYMFFGVSIGAWLQSNLSEQRISRFPRIMVILGATLVLCGVLGTYQPLNLYPEHDYYLASPLFVMIRTGCAFLFIGILALLYRYIGGVEEYCARLGKKSLYIYTAHLILLFGTPWFGGIARLWYRSLDVSTGIAMAFVVIVFTLTTAYLLDYYQRHSANVRRGLRVSLTAALLYALIV
jgi:hypothetical protein